MSCLVFRSLEQHLKGGEAGWYGYGTGLVYHTQRVVRYTDELMYIIPPEKGMNTQKRIWERQFLFPKNHVEQVHVKFPGYGILEDFRHGVFWWRDSENIEDIATLSQSIQGIPPKTAEVPIALNRIITSNHSPSRIKLLATCDGPFW